MEPPAPLSMALIYPSDHAQPVVKATVEVLTDSIKAIGLHTPITVRPVKRFADGREIDAYEIVAGRHRYEAARSLGWREIDAVIWSAEADDAELWEIDENFARRVLTDAQRADHHARREAILIRKGMVRPVGRPRNCADSAQLTSYPNQAAKALGVAKRTVQSDLRRGKKIDPAILQEIAGTDLDSGVVLDELAAAPRVEQPLLLDEIRARRAAEKVNRPDRRRTVRRVDHGAN
jgi:ParB family chromosome partitioning protein